MIELVLDQTKPPICMPVQQIVQVLEETFHEKVAIIARYGAANLRLLITKSDEGTWTAFVVDDTGRSCALGSGTEMVIQPQGEPS